MHKDSAVSFEYATSTGNMLKKTEWGEVVGSNNGMFNDTGTDKRVTDISYASSADGILIGLPSMSAMTNNTGLKLSETKTYYDNLGFGSVATGNPTRQEFWKTGTSYASTTAAYNPYGMATQQTDGRGSVTKYSYDTFNLFPAITTDALNHATSYLYDYGSGKVKQTTNPNGRVFQTVYDGLGRPLEERQPDLATPATLVPNTQYVYTDTPLNTSVHKIEYLTATLTHDVYEYVDGIGRSLQTRSRAEAADTYAVTDRVYENRGLLEVESGPYFSTGAARTGAITTGVPANTYIYDSLGRTTQMINAIGPTQYAYSLWTTTTTNRCTMWDYSCVEMKDLVKDAYGNLTQVREYNKGSVYTTQYAYDALGNLTKITDALANIRTFTYDGMGRRLTAQDLHAPADTSFGTWTYTYDDTGNVVRTLDPRGYTVNYAYDALNRVLSEDFASWTGKEVSYIYDNCGADSIGRICTVSDRTYATTTRAYNPLGLTRAETKKISNSTYTTSWTFDRLGNPVYITYPDASQVYHYYNTAGLVDRIIQHEAATTTWRNVATSIDYAPHGQPSTILYGNNGRTTNEYDPVAMYRLNRRATVLPDYGEQGSGAVSIGTGIAPASAMTMTSGGTTSTKPDKSNKKDTSSTTDDPLYASAPPPGEDPLSPDQKRNDLSSGAMVRNADTQASWITEKPADPSGETFYITGDSVSTNSMSPNEKKSRDKFQKLAVDPAPEVFFPAKYSASREPNPNSQTSKTEQSSGLMTSALLATNPPTQSTVLTTQGLWLSESITYDSSFEDNAGFWTFSGVNGTASRDCSVAYSGSCSEKITVASTSNPWDPTLSQVFRIDPKVNYILRFKARTSNAATTTFQFNVGQNHSPYLTYGLAKANAKVTPQWKTYEYRFTSSATAVDKNARIYIGLGSNTGDYWFDDIELIPDNFTKTINPGFENGTTSWAFFAVGSSTQATGNADCTSAKSGDCSYKINVLRNGILGEVPLYQQQALATGTYVVAFDAKSSVAQQGKIALMQNHSPYAVLSGEGNFPLYQDWNTYVIELTASTTDSLGNFTLSFGQMASAISVDNVRFFRKQNTKITTALPNFTAVYNDPDTTDTASSYRVQIMENGRSWSDLKWDSYQQTLSPQTVQGARTVAIPYGNTSNPLTLNDGKKYYWRIKLWDAAGNEGPWSNGKDYFTMAGDRVQDMMFTYDMANNIYELKDLSTTKTAKDIRFAYDNLDRLTSAKTISTSLGQINETYTYTPIGNLDSKTDTGAYAYSGAGYANPHAPTTIGGVAATYDNDGNLTKLGDLTASWDYRNRITATQKGTAPTSYNYYDFDNNRIITIVNGITTHFPNDLYNISGSTITKHIFLYGTMIGTVKGPVGSGVLYFDHTDHLSGANVTSDIKGKISEVTDYLPYGAIRAHEQFWGFNEQRKYAGHEFDSSSQLSFMRARYYDAGRGQFLSEDPSFLNLSRLDVQLADPQSWNSYAYAENNPITKKDPTGKYWEIAASGSALGWSGAIGFRIGLLGLNFFAAGGAGAGLEGSPFSISYIPGDLPHKTESAISIGGNYVNGVGGGLSLSGTS